MHKPLFRIAVGSVAAVGGLLVASAMPAGAATSVRAETMARTSGSPTGTTPVTFTVSTTGTLNITVPAGPVSLGTGPVSSTIGPTALGAVTVTDYRATNPSNWTASVSSTLFTNGTGDTIPVSAASYLISSVVADTVSNLPLATGIVNSAASAIPLATTPTTVVTETLADGDNAATWNPTIAIAVPALAVTGNYTGTITHSVI
jgi:hypothetical protein